MWVWPCILCHVSFYVLKKLYKLVLTCWDLRCTIPDFAYCRMDNMLIMDSSIDSGHQPPPVQKHSLNTQYQSCTIWLLYVWRCAGLLDRREGGRKIRDRWRCDGRGWHITDLSGQRRWASLLLFVSEAKREEWQPCVSQRQCAETESVACGLRTAAVEQKGFVLPIYISLADLLSYIWPFWLIIIIPFGWLSELSPAYLFFPLSNLQTALWMNIFCFQQFLRRNI